MNGLIRASLRNPYAVTVFCLTIVVIGGISLTMIPIDILPVFKSPAVQVLTFYGGMPAAGVENAISNRIERNVGQANAMARQESRSIVGASIVRNYFQPDADPGASLTQTSTLAFSQLATMPPGTLPPVILPFDPTSTVPIAIVAVSSKTQDEATLYDVGRYEVRNYIMNNRGAVAPVVFGGKVRAIMLYMDRVKMQARGLSPIDVMDAMDNFNVFLPTGDAKFGDTDYAIDSNSLYDLVGRMGDMPLRSRSGNAAFLKDVATPKDAAFIQTNVVRVDGRRQVYIPIYRQIGSSTLTVVKTVKDNLAGMQARLTRPNIVLKLVMDQSIYVSQSIFALVQEGALGAILCSLVILLFLGQIRMTAIAILTLPMSVLAATAALYAAGETINVMTLAGLSLAIGPMVDSAIICLENTHRHLLLAAWSRRRGRTPGRWRGMRPLPELVSTICTFLVLAPSPLMPGSLGSFLFKPMTLAVAFAMISAYILSRTFVPSRSAKWLKPHAGEHATPKGPVGRAFAKWEATIDRGIEAYVHGLNFVLRHPRKTIAVAFALLGLAIVTISPVIRREFFPEVDGGAFQMTVRAPSGTRIEVTEQRIKAVEEYLRTALGDDLELFISELGVTPDWSAAYTPNAGPMDAIVRVQLKEERSRSAQQCASAVREGLTKDPGFADLEFAFDTGGLIRGALNEGKSTPLNVRVTGKNPGAAPAAIADAIRARVARVDGVVDARVIQRLNYPEFVINVDRAKAADLGLTQEDVMKNVVAALNSSIQFNKKNFWLDPVAKNQYFVGVQYPEKDITSVETMMDIPISGTKPPDPGTAGGAIFVTVPLRTVASIAKTTVPTEATHYNIQTAIDLTMAVEGRDLGHVADDVTVILDDFGKLNPKKENTWSSYDPNTSADAKDRKTIEGSEIVFSGEYARMNQTFHDLAIGLVLAILLMYFLMVALDKSYVVPLTVMLTVPLALAGVLPFLLFTGTSINVQSILGIIFIVGIKVANTVLMTDFAQELRRHEGLTPTEAIRKAASIRVRPVTMTALAAFFAMIPAAMAIERGSEANAPLARAILGGLIAGEPATLFVLPCLYSLMVRDPKPRPGQDEPNPAHPKDPGHGPAEV